MTTATLSLVTPSDSDYDSARSAWNAAAAQRPQVVAPVHDVAEVAAAVKFARARGLRISAQGTGHGASASRGLDGQMLIRMDALDAIHVDPVGRTGRFEAGVIWRDAANAAREHGLAVLSGSSP